MDLGKVALPSRRYVLLGLEHRLQVDDDRLLEVLGLPDVEILDLLLDEPRNSVEVLLRQVLIQI